MEKTEGHISGYVHTGPVPNDSDLKIVTDRPFVYCQSVPDQVRKLDLQKSRSSFWNRFGPKRIRHRVNTWTSSFWYFSTILKATTCILRMLNW